MVGKILWWSAVRTEGMIETIDSDGIVTNYYLLGSKIIQKPGRIEPGYFVKFTHALPARRQNLLPLAMNVFISEHPFDAQAGTDVDADIQKGLAALAAATNPEVRQ